MEAPPRSTCCGNESPFCKWIFPRVQAMTIRSGQITSRYSLQLIKHSSHYLRSQTTRDQDLDQGLGSAQGWNGRALETAALSLSLPAKVGQLLKLNYVYLMFWFTHKLATSECRRLTLPAPPRPAPRARRVPVSPRREVAQRANNMSGRNRRTRMRKPFHYPSNWSLHAPAHTPPIQTTHVRTHIELAGYSYS